MNKITDISKIIQKFNLARSETPAIASFESAPYRKNVSAVSTIQEAKKKEFPVKPNTK